MSLIIRGRGSARMSREPTFPPVPPRDVGPLDGFEPGQSSGTMADR